MRQYEMGYSMVINMAIMLAINVGFLLYKSLKETIRKRRLDAIKNKNIENHRNIVENKKYTETFDLKAAIKSKNSWKMENWKHE